MPDRAPLDLPDPDARLQRWAWLASGAGLVLVALLVLTGVAVERMPFVGALLGMSLVWPFVCGVRSLWRWMLQASYVEWQGAYFEFDGRQIRILFDDDDGALWICAEDVFDAFDLNARARHPQRVRALAGRDGLIKPPGSRLLCFTERGFRAWMERRTDVVAGKFMLWFERQVVQPYRRRLEIEGRVPAPTALDERPGGETG